MPRKNSDADEMYSDEDDDLVQEVSISDRRKQLSEASDKIRKHIETEKGKLKDKRRKHHILLTEQKKNKITTYEEDEDEEEDSLEVTKNKPEADGLADISGEEPATTADEDNAASFTGDFVPLNREQGGIRPVYMKDFLNQNSALETALEFKSKHLYGNRVKRQSMTKHLAMAEKRKARKEKTPQN